VKTLFLFREKGRFLLKKFCQNQAEGLDDFMEIVYNEDRNPSKFID
jgi:hypothetical protein